MGPENDFDVILPFPGCGDASTEGAEEDHFVCSVGGIGFYCCGLCSKRKSKKTNGKAAANGATNGKNGSAAISVSELEKVLNAQKKGDNKDKAVKTLAEHAKSGKPLPKAFKVLEGKT